MLYFASQTIARDDENIIVKFLKFNEKKFLGHVCMMFLQ